MSDDVLEAIDSLEAQKQALLLGEWVQGEPEDSHQACALVRTQRWEQRYVLCDMAARALALAIGEILSGKDVGTFKVGNFAPFRFFCSRWNDYYATGPDQVIDRLERAQQLLKELL